MLYFLESCLDSIRTIPSLPHDEHDAEDLDTEAEDHAADETRYACMSRPWLPKGEPPEPIVYPQADPRQFGLAVKKHFERQHAAREEMSLG
jgi:hypothetical protein